jgi:hypothetical protein
LGNGVRGEGKVPMPTTLYEGVGEQYVEMKETRSDIRLRILVLKKAELSVQLDRLGEELEFWVRVWVDATNSFKA